MTKSLANPSIRFLFAILLGMLAGGCGVEVPTGADQQEASAVVRAMESRYHFRVMSSSRAQPAIYERPHPKYSEVFIYGDYTSKEQDEICVVARTVRREVAKRPIYLYFYPRENEQRDLIRKEAFD